MAPSSPSHDRLVAFRRAQARLGRPHARTLRVRGLPMRVVLTPEVPGRTPLVCVNGGLLHDHRLLWPALAPLALGRQLVLYDQRGRGESAPPPHPLAARIEDDADDLGALREALGIARWDVLGHSWGGGIALNGAARDPRGTRRLVLVDSVGPTSSWMPGLLAAAAARLVPPERTELERFHIDDLGVPDPERLGAFARALFPAWFADPELARRVVPPRSSSITGAAVYARLWREGYDWTAVARAVSVPSLVLFGDRDVLPRATADELAALMPRAALSILEGTGHLPFLEAPESFFTAVEAFLAAA